MCKLPLHIPWPASLIYSFIDLSLYELVSMDILILVLYVYLTVSKDFLWWWSSFLLRRLYLRFLHLHRELKVAISFQKAAWFSFCSQCILKILLYRYIVDSSMIDYGYYILFKFTFWCSAIYLIVFLCCYCGFLYHAYHVTWFQV